MTTSIEQDTLLDRGGNPTLRELLLQLVFSPANGTIRLNKGRLILQRISQAGHLREELTQQVGKDEAFILMSRLGFQAGSEDADFVRASWPSLDPGDAFTSGTRLHTLSGCVRVETVHNDFDFRKGAFSGEFLWHDSAEAVDYCERHHRAHEPVCWSQIGYASGYATAFFGKLVVFKETQCLAMGDKHCRVIGKPAEKWGEDDAMVQLFRRDIMPRRRAALTPARERPEDDAAAAPVAAKLTAALLAPVKAHLDLAAASDIAMLITGEPGSGKRAAAMYLHAAAFGPRALAEQVDCAGLDADGLSNLLAAGARGTGAGRRPQRALRTLILSNIEALGARAQDRLVAFLDAGRDAPAALSPRIIALSCASPADLALRPALRRDLFYRLTALPVVLPPLRSRRADLPPLVRLILQYAAARQACAPPTLSQAAVSDLSSRDLPGNLPELEALLMGAMLRARPGATIEAVHLRGIELPLRSLESSLDHAIASGKLSVGGLNQKLYQAALRRADGNVSDAARTLGLSRAQLAYRLGRPQARPS